ncbi:MAG: hypothetical protein LUG57_00400 [Oscillospiraceae bacterium]|nr:hypothetical protein [Oscillospiraceae bacterium]
MKKISLSGQAVRLSCLIGDVLLAGIAGVWLWCAFSWLALLVIGAGAVLLAFYHVLVFRSAVLVEREEKRITLRGLQSRTDDVSAAACVFTEERTVDGHTTRVIQVADESGTILSSISTLSSIHQGYAAEVTAQALAEALGVEFRPTVPKHLYDRKARRAYQREQEEKARQARRQKRQKRKNRKNRKNGQDAPQANDTAEDGPSPVNYDELDDEET